MLTTVHLAHQVVTLERRIKELQHHVLKLETAISAAHHESPRRRSWWQAMWRRGGGAGRTKSVRENRRRESHERIQQSQLYCA